MTVMNHQKRGINIMVTVDWEGRDLSEENLKAMEDIRKEFPEIPYTHYLNAAYYTKADADAKETTSKTLRVLSDHDEHGLHLHAWRRLVEASGVEFHPSPTFKNDCDDCSGDEDCGVGVPLWTYSREDLVKMLETSKKILKEQGFRPPVSFRSGGWMSAPEVTSALIDSGFKTDSSDVATYYVSRRWEGTNLDTWIKKFWGKSTEISQPYRQKQDHGSLWQLVDNGALADYIDGPEMWQVIDNNMDALSEEAGSQGFVVVGFHTETAAKFLPRLRDFFRRVEAYNKGTPDLDLKFMTIHEASCLLEQQLH